MHEGCYNIIMILLCYTLRQRGRSLLSTIYRCTYTYVMYDLSLFSLRFIIVCKLYAVRLL